MIPTLRFVGETPRSLSLAPGITSITETLKPGATYLVQITNNAVLSDALDASVLVMPTVEGVYAFTDNTAPMLTTKEVTTSGVEGPSILSYFIRVPDGHYFLSFKNLSGSLTARIRYNRVFAEGEKWS